MYNDVITAITTVGFPIVACLVMGWYLKYTTDKNTEQINDLTKTHNEEMKSVTDALNNNTLALQRLCDKLGD